MHASSPSSLSFSSLVQYAFFAGVLYILAGAPLQSLFTSNTSTYAGNSGRDGNGAQKKLENLVVPENGLACKEHAYKGIHVLNREPLVVYIEGFLSDDEADHVVGLR
jgi:prolyl 4-hydroxylase